MRDKRGFTLIELLIAIVLLGILSSMISYVSTSALKKARDAKRKADLKVLMKGVLAAANECEGTHFVPGGAGQNFSYLHYGSLRDYLLQFNYINEKIDDPKHDPLNTGLPGDDQTDNLQEYHYIDGTQSIKNLCFANGSDLGIHAAITGDVVFFAHLEITNDPEANKSYTACQSQIATQNGVLAGWSPVLEDPNPLNSGNGFYYVCNN